MTSEIHFVLQGKGGVGKSVVARLLAEYMIHTGRDYQGFDADAVNQSFAAVEGLSVGKVDLLDGAKIDTRKFDTLMVDIVANNDQVVIIDSGASSFLPMMSYIETAHVIDTLLDRGFEVFIHTIVTGGPSRDDTFKGFEQITQRFGNLCNVVVWANPFFGSVQRDDVAFIDLPGVKKTLNDGQIIGVIPIPELTNLTQEDFAEFLTSQTLFAAFTAKDNKDVNMMVKIRLNKAHATLMGIIAEVIGEPAEETADATE